MEINYTLILIATVIQFIVGAVWYSPLMFGKTWMKINEKENVGKEEIKKMQREMGPFYGLQLFLTLVFTWALANNIAGSAVNGVSAYAMAFYLWFGIIVPVQVSAVIWGNTKKKFWLKQIAILTGMQFVGIMIAAFILSM